MTKESEIDECQLIHKIVAGERQLFSVLMRHHESFIFGLVMRQVGNKQTAEDLTQEIFIKAFTQLSRFRFEARFRSWVTRIAFNEMSSFFSSKRFKDGKKSEAFNPEEHGAVADEERDEKLLEQKAQRLKNALGELAPHYREAIVLCGLQGQSYVEAAALLEIPVGTVRSRLNKARLLLRGVLTSGTEECDE